MIIHTVKTGDTVFNIARKYGVAPHKIIENNELLNPDRLTVGEKLLIFRLQLIFLCRKLAYLG